MMLVLVGLSVVAQPASANTRDHSFGTVELSGGDWLNGAGVTVYSNGATVDGPSPDTYNYVTSPSNASIQSGIKWQCVELVNRLYIAHGWIGATWHGNGYQMYDNAPSGLAKEPQNAVTYVNPGDVIAFGGGTGGLGHVAIVNNVTDNGNGTKAVHTVSQNTQNVGMDSTWNVAAGTLSNFLGGSYYVQGIIHAPAEAGGSGASPRIGFLSGGTLYVKEGGVGAQWVLETTNVASFKLSPHRIAVADTSGNLIVKDGSLGAQWVTVGGAGSEYQVTDDMVAVLSGTDLAVKLGPLNATWSTILNPVQDFQVSPSDHIAARMADGTIVVQWGPVGSGWTAVTSGASSYRITDNRLGVMSGGMLNMKVGAVGATWVAVGGGQSFELSPNRIALLDNGNNLVVKEGSIYASWTTVTSNPVEYRVTDTRIGMIDGGNNLSVKDGGVGAMWTLVTTGAAQFELT